MRAAANREQTLIIVLPEGHSGSNSAGTDLLNEFGNPLSPSRAPINPLDDTPGALGSSGYRTSNSSSDTIPEISVDENHHASPPITLIKAGAHKHINVLAGDQTEHLQIKLEDTVQDLELTSEFEIEYIHTPRVHRPLTAGEPSSKRRLSSRSAAQGKRRARTEADVSSSPLSFLNIPLNEQQEELALLSSRPNTQETVVPNHGFQSSQGSSMNTSSVESPPSLILRNSTSPLKSHEHSNATEESTFHSDAPETNTEIHEYLASPRKRRIRSSTACTGLTYNKKVKHSHLKRQATAMDTFIISSSPVQSDVEDTQHPIPDLYNTRISSSPPYRPSQVSPCQHKDLEDTTCRLGAQLSLCEEEREVIESPPQQSVEFGFEEENSVSLSILHNQAIEINKKRYQHAFTLNHTSGTEHRVQVTENIIQNRMSVDEDVITCVTQPIESQKCEGNTAIQSLQSPQVLESCSGNIDSLKSKSIDTIKGKRKAEATLSNSTSLSMDLVVSEDTTPVVPKRKGPSIRVGLSKFAQVFPLHGYLKRKNA